MINLEEFFAASPSHLILLSDALPVLFVGIEHHNYLLSKIPVMQSTFLHTWMPSIAHNHCKIVGQQFPKLQVIICSRPT